MLKNKEKEGKEGKEKKVKKNIKIETVNLIVISTSRAGGYRMSRPCDKCLEFMKNIRHVLYIRKIYYFNQDGKMVCENLNDMKYEHMSNGWRHTV